MIGDRHMLRILKTWSRGKSVIIVVAVLGVVFSAMAAWFVAREEAGDARQKFVAMADTYAEVIRESVEEHLLTLRILGDSISILPSLTEDDFRLLTNSPLHHHPGYQRIQWMVPLSSSAVTPATPFSILHSLTHQGEHVHGHESDQDFIDTDPAADPSVRGLLNRTMDSGNMVMSDYSLPKVTVFLPVYRSGPLVTADQRRGALLGIIGNEFQMANLVEHGIHGFFKNPAGIDIAIHSLQGGHLILRYKSRVSSPDVGKTDPLNHLRQVDIVDQKWLLTFTAIDPHRFSSSSGHMPWVVFSGGMILTLSLVFYLSTSARQTERLRNQRAQLHSVTESVQDAIITIDPRQRITFWNQGAETGFGYSGEEARSRSLFRLFPEPVRDKYRRELLAFIDPAGEGRANHEWMARHRNGEAFPVAVSLSRLRTDSGQGLTLVIRDIRERRAALERDFRTYQSRLAISALLETSLEPLTLQRQLEVALDIILTVPWLAVEDRGSIFLADEKSGQLFLTAQKKLAPNLLASCARVPYGHCMCGRAAESGRIVFASHLDDRHDIRFDDMHGHGHYCVPITSGKTVIGVLNIYLAEGHRHDPEEDAFMITVANTLAGIIIRCRQDEALLRAKKLAERATRAKSEFLANMSHEIRTPMNAIIGLGHLLFKTGLTTRQQDYLRKIHFSSQSLLNILNDILDFSKIEAGKLTLESVPFHLDEVLRNAIGLVEHKAREKGLEVLYSIPEALPGALKGDPLRLGQVLANLIGNAVKFTESGEIVITIRSVYLAPISPSIVSWSVIPASV